MNKHEKKIIEITLKGILYYITDSHEQEKVLNILKTCEANMNDSKLKNKIDDILYKFKNDYFARVDFLIDDIISSKMTNGNKKIIYEMIEELQPAIEENQKNKSGFWDNLRNLFKWS